MPARGSSQYGLPPGVYRTSDGRHFGARVWIARLLHDLGCFNNPDDAAAVVRQVEERHPNRLTRRRGYSISAHRGDWFLLRGPSPGRKCYGLFPTQWHAEQAAKRLNLGAT
jgi:hypothetical protein